MENKTLLLSLQKGIVKELCSKGLLTEEQTQLAIKEFEQVFEEYLIKEEVKNNERNNNLL